MNKRDQEIMRVLFDAKRPEPAAPRPVGSRPQDILFDAPAGKPPAPAAPPRSPVQMPPSKDKQIAALLYDHDSKIKVAHAPPSSSGGTARSRRSDGTRRTATG